jgi:iron(III) transport system substrate-binding protein
MRWHILVTMVLVVGLAGLAGWLFLAGKPAQVVLYCSVDRDQSEALIDLFRQESGLSVDFQGDLEADKSVGLAVRLSRERANPRADVFWANEAMNTIWLADAGVLDVLPDEVLNRFPEPWRDPHKRYVMFGLRARVLLVNTTLVLERDFPTQVSDLVDWKARHDTKYAHLKTAMAAPLTGTTYTHAVALLTANETAAKDFLERVVKTAEEGRLTITTGNGPAMNLVRDAKNGVAFCLTDTDDAWAAQQAGAPVAVVYPDQGDGQPGTMVIPNTLALVKGRAHAAPADHLLRWLSGPAIEERLAAGPSAQMPVRDSVPVPADGHVKRPGKDFRVMAVDWQTIGANRDRWLDLLTRLFRPAK